MDILIIGKSHADTALKDVMAKMIDEYDAKIMVIDSLDELIIQTRDKDFVLEPEMDIIDLNNLEKLYEVDLLKEKLFSNQEKIRYTKNDIKRDNKIYMKKVYTKRR